MQYFRDRPTKLRPDRRTRQYPKVSCFRQNWLDSVRRTYLASSDSGNSIYKWYEILGSSNVLGGSIDDNSPACSQCRRPRRGKFVSSTCVHLTGSKQSADLRQVLSVFTTRLYYRIVNWLQANERVKATPQKGEQSYLEQCLSYTPILFPTHRQTGNGMTSCIVRMLWLSHFMVLRTFTFNKGSHVKFLKCGSGPTTGTESCISWGQRPCIRSRRCSPLLVLRISSTPSPLLPPMASDVGTHIPDWVKVQPDRNRDNFNIDALPNGVKISSS